MLRSRRKIPPGGFQFRQVQTNWKYSGMFGFENAVLAVYKHRKANPVVCKNFNLSLDLDAIRREVDEYNCARLNYDPAWCVPNQVIDQMAPPPKLLPPAEGAAAGVAKIKRIAVGVRLLIDWIGSGGIPVEQKVAEARALVCSVCPMNAKGDLLEFFTSAAAKQIQNQLAMKNDMSLKTSRDENLHVCKACGCSLPLKVWVPIEHIRKHMPKESVDALHSNCWITNGTSKE